MSCPTMTSQTEKVLMAHGSGGTLSSQLLDTVFLPAFSLSSESLHDGAIFTLGDQQFAFTTDTYVVNPLFFPGGNIGDLAVNGTVNDLAMCGAVPQFLSCGFVLEEGFDLSSLQRIVSSMQAAAQKCGVELVTGDTKVVERGKGDGVFINTSGIGLIRGPALSPKKIQTGDVVIVSGDIGRHGTAILSEREGFTFESTIESDTMELSSMMQQLLKSQVDIHCARDITRGGLATILVELAQSAGLGMAIDESRVPVNGFVRGACEFLGLDPLYVACEGRFVLFVPASEAKKALQIIGPAACIIGEVLSDSPFVTAKTSIGSQRIIDKLSGDQLPRIC